MKKLNFIEKLINVLLVCLCIYFLFKYFQNNYEIKNLSYGVKANSLRQSLNIPIIDENMNAVNMFDDYFGNRWETNRDEPQKNEILHTWKKVIPSEEKNFLLAEEWDAFRRRDSDDQITQFNIYTKVKGDSFVERNGKIFFYNSEVRNKVILDERGIDSVAKKWNLNHLIRNINK